MGNFITLNSTFDWCDIDISEHFRMFYDAVESASKNKDCLFYHPNLLSENEESAKMFNHLWNSDFDTFKSKYKWINQLDYQRLMSLKNYFRPSPNGAKSLQDLAQNTRSKIENNSWVGLYTSISEPLVYNTETWKEFHQKYVSTFSRTERKSNKEYFNKFYMPQLLETPNSINNYIRKNKNSPFLRLDTPNREINGKTLHGEQIQIHFNDTNKSCLNIDGKWKHGKFDIPSDICDKLIEWGFVLPENRE